VVNCEILVAIMEIKEKKEGFIGKYHIELALEKIH
jgi:hypothetical protein